MKNFKINKKIITILLVLGTGVVSFTYGSYMGYTKAINKESNEEDSQDNEEIINNYLKDYIAKRDSLEQEINELLEEKEKLQNNQTFNMNDLIVMENTNIDNETNLYILSTTNSGICYEYHNDFKAWYRIHSESEEHYDICSNYIHFDECQPLFNYLTDEEIEDLTMNNGKITTVDLDKILERIRTEYKEQKLEKNY